jgi:hypothetical protein
MTIATLDEDSKRSRSSPRMRYSFFRHDIDDSKPDAAQNLDFSATNWFSRPQREPLPAFHESHDVAPPIHCRSRHRRPKLLPCQNCKLDSSVHQSRNCRAREAAWHVRPSWGDAWVAVGKMTWKWERKSRCCCRCSHLDGAWRIELVVLALYRPLARYKYRKLYAVIDGSAMCNVSDPTCHFTPPNKNVYKRYRSVIHFHASKERVRVRIFGNPKHV